MDTTNLQRRERDGAQPCAERGLPGVDTDGRVLVEDARHSIGLETALVTAMHSNNETGVLQPVAELAEPAHASGAILHTDALSVGKVPMGVKDRGVDLLSMAGHKVYAPKGVGILFVRRVTTEDDIAQAAESLVHSWRRVVGDWLFPRRTCAAFSPPQSALSGTRDEISSVDNAITPRCRRCVSSEPASMPSS